MKKSQNIDNEFNQKTHSCNHLSSHEKFAERSLQIDLYVTTSSTLGSSIKWSGGKVDCWPVSWSV